MGGGGTRTSRLSIRSDSEVAGDGFFFSGPPESSRTDTRGFAGFPRPSPALMCVHPPGQRPDAHGRQQQQQQQPRKSTENEKFPKKNHQDLAARSDPRQVGVTNKTTDFVCKIQSSTAEKRSLMSKIEKRTCDPRCKAIVKRLNRLIERVKPGTK